MKTNTSFLLCLLITFSLSTQKRDYNIFTIPKELTEHASEVVRLDYMNFVIDSLKPTTLHIKYVATLLSGKSDAAEQYVFYNQHSKVTNLSAKIYNAMGNEVRKVKSKEFIDRSAVSNGTIYNDSRLKTIEFHHSSYPYTIDINSEGAAVIRKQSTYTGPRHDFYRYISNNFSKEEVEKIFLENTALPAFTMVKLEIYAVELPAGRYNELRDFYKEIAKADGMKAVLVKKKA